MSFANFNSASLYRRTALVLLALTLGFGLLGCDAEPTQRKAFMSFLQTRILDKTGARIPRPNAEEEKSFGPYVKHYAVIRDFNAAMNDSVSKPMQEVIAKGTIRSLGDLMAHKNDLAALRSGIAQLNSVIDTQLAKANSERAALKQPDDLKAVYDQAYARTVSTPAKVMKDVFPALDATFESAHKLAEYIDQHSGSIKITGSLIEVSDPKIQSEVNTLIENMTAKSKEIIEAHKKLRGLAS